MMMLSVLPIPKIAYLLPGFKPVIELEVAEHGRGVVALQDSRPLSPRALPLRRTERRSFTVASSAKYQGFGIPGFLPML